VSLRRAALALVVLASCGDSSRPPAANGTSPPPEDAGAGDGAAPDAGLADDPSSVFRLVGPLAGVNASAGAGQFPVIHGGFLYLLGISSARFALADARAEKIDIAGSWSSDHSEGGTCQVGGRVTMLGGGGNGLFGAWHVFDWDWVDLDARTWTKGGTATWAAHKLAVTSVGSECIAIGGDANPSGALGTAAVRVLDTATSQWTSKTALPEPRSMHGAAALGSLVVVAGGRCGPCTAGGSDTKPVSLDSVVTLDWTGATPGWQPAAKLPRPLVGLRMLALRGRVYALGGRDSYETTTTSREVLSWAPGEAAWKTEGLAPAGASALTPLTDGDAIFLVAVHSGQLALYRHRP